MRPVHGDPPEDEQEELPKVTVAHLRRAATLCARRLALEHDDRRSMRRGTGRFRVQNQLLEDARLTHVDLGVPDAGHFRPGDDLTAEEGRLYDTASRWYVALYQDHPVRSVDLAADATVEAIDDWATRVDALKVRLVGRCGLAVESADGRRGVRLLRLGRGVPAGDMLDDVEVRFAVLRLSGWAGTDMHLSIADLVHGARRDESMEPERVPGLQHWLAERVDVVRARVADPDVSPGIDCGSCSFVPGCPAHK
jgi:hypothetical protein